MKVLLLNPPFFRKVLRDNYCSHFSKGNYLWHPIDFLYLSGFLYANKIDFWVLDCILDMKGERECINIINSYLPNVIIALSGYATFYRDKNFFIKLKKRFPDIKLLVGGDLFIGENRDWEKFGIDGVLPLFFNIDNHDIFIDYSLNSSFYLPRYEYFIHKNYYIPYLKTYKWMSILASFSCPHSCFFCPVSNIDYFERDIKWVEMEITHIKRMGIEFLFFRDQSFNPERRYFKEILNILKHYGISFSISTRLDYLNDENIKLLKKSGCCLIQCGVETSNQKFRKHINKCEDDKIIILKVNKIKKEGIELLIHFMVSDKTNEVEDVKFIRKLDPDFLSLNILTPLPNTKLGNEKGLIDYMNFSGDSSVFTLNENIKKKYRYIYRHFYYSPNFLIKTIHNINYFRAKLYFLEFFRFSFKL